MFLEQFDSATVNFEAQAETQIIQLATHESISIYACRVEDLSIKWWLEFDSAKKNCDSVKVFIQCLPFKLKCIANENKLDHNPTVDEPVIAFETLKNFVYRKHLAYEMTPRFLNEVHYLETQERQSHQSRSQTRFQTDPDIEDSPQFNEVCRRNGHSISRCFKRQTDKYRRFTFKYRQHYDAQPKSATQ